MRLGVRWQFKIAGSPRQVARRDGRAAWLQAMLLVVAVGLGQVRVATAEHAVEHAVDEAFRQQRARLDVEFAAAMDSLAKKCDELQLPDRAAVCRAWPISRDPRRKYLFLPPEIDPAKPSADADKVVQFWYGHFSTLRRKLADELFRLAEQSLADGRPARAYQLLHETLHENPNHERARAILGYRQVNGRWRKPTATISSKLTRTANPELGFAAGKHWVIESEHFAVTTNDSAEAGTALVQQLEQLHAVWRQLFFDYWSSTAALQRQFSGDVSARRSLERHRVVLFANREHYLAALKPKEPRIEVSIGIYWEPQHTAYFYSGSNRDVWFHEVTHQLFAETSRVAPAVGTKANAWLVEGIALYMESLQPQEDYFTAGGIDASRLQFARYQALTAKFYVPLAELAGMSRQSLQQREDLPRLYSQAAGLANFLMHGRRETYRDALVQSLKATYEGRDQAGTLAELAGAPFEQLDREYIEDLNVTDEVLAELAAQPTAEELALGHTAVTDTGVQHLAGHTQLRWLDLSNTSVSDTGFASLENAAALRHLTLEKTNITDGSLKLIGRFRDLEILDLTGCDVSDDGLAELTRLTNLTELWLGGTRVSDAGLEHLQAMKKLKTLDVGGTSVTTAGWKRLKESLPSLKDD